MAKTRTDATIETSKPLSRARLGCTGLTVKGILQPFTDNYYAPS